jgi:nucleoside-diphosphate-sugar epimerase
MKVLLTGSSGYIGSVMSAKLQEAGHDVVGLDTNFFADCNLGVPPQILEIKKDIRDVSIADLCGFDAIIHLAALSNDPMGEINSSLTYDINLYATLKLAEKAKIVGIDRFIYASSCSIYGAGDGDEVLNEDSPLAPITHYAMSKAFAEEGLTRLADSSFSPVFMRNATVHGYSPRMRTDLVLNTMAAHAYTKGAITVMGDGTLWRPIVHVEDVCNAFILALEAPREVVHNQAFNVGSGNRRDCQSLQRLRDCSRRWRKRREKLSGRVSQNIGTTWVYCEMERWPFGRAPSFRVRIIGQLVLLQIRGWAVQSPRPIKEVVRGRAD